MDFIIHQVKVSTLFQGEQSYRSLNMEGEDLSHAFFTI